MSAIVAHLFRAILYKREVKRATGVVQSTHIHATNRPRNRYIIFIANERRVARGIQVILVDKRRARARVWHSTRDEWRNAAWTHEGVADKIRDIAICVRNDYRRVRMRKWSVRARAWFFWCRILVYHGIDIYIYIYIYLTIGETHLLAVAKFHVSLDNTTVIHHCRGLGLRLPNAALWYFSHYRVRSAEIPRRDTICGTRRPHRVLSFFFLSFFRYGDGTGITAARRESRGKIHTATDQSRAPTAILTLSTCYAHQRALARFSSRARNTYASIRAPCRTTAKERSREKAPFSNVGVEFSNFRERRN